jgi:hypothetical protein
MQVSLGALQLKAAAGFGDQHLSLFAARLMTMQTATTWHSWLHSSVGTRARIPQSSARRAMKKKKVQGQWVQLQQAGWTRQINPNHSLTAHCVWLFICRQHRRYFCMRCDISCVVIQMQTRLLDYWKYLNFCTEMIKVK